MKILLVYPGHATSTIDVANGWFKALRKLGHDVRPWHYHDTITFYTKALEYWGEQNPDFAYDSTAIRYLTSRGAVAEAVDFGPRVAIVVTGTSVHPCFYSAMYKLNIPTVFILTESPYADKLQVDMCNSIRPETVFVNEQRSLYKFARWQATYLPHSYDSTVHKPMDVGDAYKSDVLFIGTIYPERKKLLESVNWEGIDLKVFGPEIGSDDTTKSMANSEVAKWYNGAKICLNLHRTISGADAQGRNDVSPEEVWSLSPRAFEIAACGGFQIADNSRGELESTFKGAVPTFRTAQEMEEMVRWYLSHPEERRALALRQRDAVQGCAFEERARMFLIPRLEGLNGNH